MLACPSTLDTALGRLTSSPPYLPFQDKSFSVANVFPEMLYPRTLQANLLLFFYSTFLMQHVKQRSCEYLLERLTYDAARV